MRYKAPYELTKDKGDQGWDIRANIDTVLNPSQTKLIDTGLYFEFEECIYADVRARSSLSSEGILCHTGLVDSEYRGEIKVCLTNLSGGVYLIRKGDRIAQLVFGKEIVVEPIKADEIDTDTSRGDKGFGSSGKD
ncbi:dUTP diphosphatase [uncultured Anaerococcus sp.]|uniref:dUTP diphosphatase n=1 Tax=uncultured Anaerococcus sp. TaxID=293428 RepID=UPI002889A2D3|nr:dUTP diphosphatase [uncultured Anaerococcus sp.]